MCGAGRQAPKAGRHPPKAGRHPRQAGFFFFFIFPPLLRARKERNYQKKKNTKKQESNIVLNNKEDPMHDTTNTCSCDYGVRSWVVVPRFYFSVLTLFYFSEFRFSVSTWACGRDRHHDTSGRNTHNSGVSFIVVTHLFRSCYVSGHGFHWAHSARILHAAPLKCVLRRVVNTARFSKACLFATLVLPRRTFAERRRAVKSPTALPTRSVAMASPQCRGQPLLLNRRRPRTLAKT